jgi:hypothetical protein
MARTEIPYTSLQAAGSVADPAGTTINAGPAGGHYIDRAEPERTILRVVTDAGGGGDLSIAVGGTPLAVGQAALLFSLSESDTVWLGPFESGRHVLAGAATGRLHIDVQAGVAGTITAFLVPAHV